MSEYQVTLLEKVLEELRRLGDKLEEIKMSSEHSEELVNILGAKVDDYFSFIKDATFYLGEKVVGNHEDRIASLENS